MRTLVVLFALAGIAIAAPTREDWLHGARNKIGQLQRETIIAEARADAALKSNNEANQEVGRLGAENKQLVKDANTERQEKIDAWKREDKLKVDLAHVLKRLHWWKWSASILGTILIWIGCLYMGIVPPLLFYVAIPATGIVNGLIWTFL